MRGDRNGGTGLGRVGLILAGLGPVLALGCASDHGLDFSRAATGGAGSGTNAAAAGVSSTADARTSHPLLPSVPAELPVVEMTGEQVEALCADIVRFEQANVALVEHDACITNAVVNTKEIGADSPADAKRCREAYDACMASPSASSPGPDCSDVARQGPTCDATPNEIGECLQGSLEALEHTDASFDCETSTVADLASDPATGVPDGCLELRERCAFFAK